MRTGRIFILLMVLATGIAGPVLAADCTCDVNHDGDITPLDALLLSDKIRGNCPTSLGIPCEDICSDVNADGSLNDADVQMIFDRYFGEAGECAALAACDQCWFRQEKVKQTIMDIAYSIFQFYEKFNYSLFSIDKLGISVKNDTYYEYSIQDIENDPPNFRIIASSKAPGISGGGKGDDVWIYEYTHMQSADLIHTVNSCPDCPESNCFSCLRDQESVRNSLGNISKNEEAYLSENDTFTGNLPSIGFNPASNAKYEFSVTADDRSFLATASSKAPGIMGAGAGDDIWTINQEVQMNNTVNACSECPEPSGNNCDVCLEKQNEARQSLGTISKNQEAYFAENDFYANDTQRIGFTVNGIPRYEYFIQSTGITYIAIAVSKEPGIMGKGGGDDIWTINEKLELKHTVNACSACPGITSDKLRSEILKTDYFYSACVARQYNARQSLTAIAQSEISFFSQNNRFASYLYQLGLPYLYNSYYYGIEIGNGGSSFVATAYSRYPGINGGGSSDDVWTINQNLELTNVKDACACYSSGVCPLDNVGIFANISDGNGGVTAVVSLGKTPNDVASVAFDLIYDPAVLKFKTASPGLLLQNFEKFSVREISPGRIRAGGYTTGSPIPANTDADLATLTFDILGPCSTDLKFVSLKDNMVSWQEHTLRYSAGNELAHAIALLRIAAGQNTEIPACIPDIGNDSKKGLAEVVWLLQETVGLR